MILVIHYELAQHLSMAGFNKDFLSTRLESLEALISYLFTPLKNLKITFFIIILFQQTRI